MAPAPDKPIENAPETPAAAPATAKGGLVDRLGAWADRHRAFFRSHKGDLLIRNALNSCIDWIPTVGSFMLTRAAYGKYDQYAAKNPGSLLTTLGKPLLDRKEFPVGSLVTFIFGGWFTYRATRRFFYRAYDRLFATHNAQEAADAIRAMPGNLIRDAKEVIPGGLAEVVPGAFALASIKCALAPANPANNFIKVGKGQWDRARKGWLNDTLATGVAYSTFTEICDHIYPAATHGKDTEKYYRELQGLPPKEEIQEDKKHFGFFTNDNAPRMIFKTTASVLLGFAVYFAGQRAAKAAFGLPTDIERSLGKIARNFAVDYAAWVPFTAYTVIAQLYKEQYDKLFSRLEKWAAGKENGNQRA